MKRLKFTSGDIRLTDTGFARVKLRHAAGPNLSGMPRRVRVY